MFESFHNERLGKKNFIDNWTVDLMIVSYKENGANLRESQVQGKYITPSLKCGICSLGTTLNVCIWSFLECRKVWPELVWVLERTVGYFTIWFQNINHTVGIAYAVDAVFFFFFKFKRLKNYIYIYIYVCISLYILFAKLLCSI